MKKNLWTEEMLRTLAELYPMETNAFTASVLQVGETAVKEKARELGLVKVVKSKWLNRAEHIRSHFEERSFTEIARELGITRHSVSRIAGKLSGKFPCQDGNDPQGKAEGDFWIGSGHTDKGHLAQSQGKAALQTQIQRLRHQRT